MPVLSALSQAGAWISHQAVQVPLDTSKDGQGQYDNGLKKCTAYLSPAVMSLRRRIGRPPRQRWVSSVTAGKLLLPDVGVGGVGGGGGDWHSAISLSYIMSPLYLGYGANSFTENSTSTGQFPR